MTTDAVVTKIPVGTWEVVPGESELGFGARGMFGLIPVHGHFDEFSGTLTAGVGGVRGELQIRAGSLNTHNAKRDEHLRSPDFFDVDAHPTLSFELTGMSDRDGESVTVDGVLRIRGNALAVATPVEVRRKDAGRLVLISALEVDRSAAGVGWSKMGMVQGKARLNARLTLTQTD